MSRIPTAVIPKTVFSAIHHRKSPIQVSQALVDSASMDSVEIFQKFETRREGLTEAEAIERLAKFGPNLFAKDQRVRIGALIWHAVINPLVSLSKNLRLSTTSQIKLLSSYRVLHS